MNKIKLELKWSMIFIAVMLLWMLIEKLTGLHSEHIDKHPIYTNFVAIPAIIVYVLALLDKRKKYYNGVMTYKQGVVSGLIITLILTVLSPLTQYIISTIISPDYFSNVIEYSVKNDLMTQENAENYFNLKSYIKQTLIGTLIMGLITTIIVAFFTKKKV